MNTNFPNFSSYEQDEDEFNFTPTASTEQPITPQIKTSEMERFWGVTGNWGEFGLYFGIGLSASLVVRAIPALIPSAVILVPAVGVGLALMGAIAPTEDRTRYQVLLIALFVAIIGGNWDGWIAWLVANAWKIGLTLSLIGVGLYFVPTLGGKKNV